VINLSPDSVPSPALAQLLVATRNGYDWPVGTGAEVSQQNIINLEATVAGRLTHLNAANAHQIVVDVSSWAGNYANPQAQLVAATPAQQEEMLVAIGNLISGNLAVGIDTLSALPGISLVIASKIFRFCAPQVGAAVDRHSSYFFNSLPIDGHGSATNFEREWADGQHNISRLAGYAPLVYARNRNEYIQCYLPLLGRIASRLNESDRQYRCAATGELRLWTPADVEMAAYYYWACNGAR
jgi:hypothetical protein